MVIEAIRSAVPQPVRTKVGLWRRLVADQWTRMTSARPAPPPRLLRRVQLTPFLEEYQRVGSRCAEAVSRILSRNGLGPEGRVLDFGCGCGRTLAFLGDQGWSLSGCDVDAEAVEWCARHFSGATFAVSGSTPPLPYPRDEFDAVYAISVFTHLDEVMQRAWFQEMERVLVPGGLLLISTMGENAFGTFPTIATEESTRRFRDEGFWFESRPGAFNESAAFHAEAGVVRLAEPGFDLVESLPRELLGFQDLYLLRARR